VLVLGLVGRQRLLYRVDWGGENAWLEDRNRHEQRTQKCCVERSAVCLAWCTSEADKSA